MTTTTGFSPRQAGVLLLVNVALTLALMGIGLLYQFKGWKLDGAHLIGLGVVLINVQNYFLLQLRQTTTRIDALENKLAAAPPR